MNENQIPLLAVAGDTGLNESFGYVQEDFVSEWNGAEAADIVKRMLRNTSVIGGFRTALSAIVGRVPWSINAAETGHPQAGEAATFVAECFQDLNTPWRPTVYNFLSYVWHGWSFNEIVYKIRGGWNPRIPQIHSKYSDRRIGWADFSPRAQSSLHRWDIGETGRINGMWQNVTSGARTGTFYIPSEKALHFRFLPENNNPEGTSILRPAYTDYYYLSRLKPIEAIGIERDLAGMPVMEIPGELLNPGASADQVAAKRNWEKFISKVRRDELMGALIPSETDPRSGKPSGYRLRLLASGGRNPVDVNEVIKRYESRILVSMLAEFLVLGLDKVGALALSNDKTDLFGMCVASILDNFTDTMNTVAIPQLLRLNGFPPESFSTLTYGEIKAPSLPEFAQFVSTLSTSGALTIDENLENRVREVGDLGSKGGSVQIAI